jgi:3-deoxy-manno-octulosonate cytidylyltransferase (CMP-KDO synthetase)
MIDEAVQALLDQPDVPMATIKTKIQRETDLKNPNVVKVVTNEYGRALYFSRSLIPFPRATQEVTYYEHLGLYVYRRDFLLQLAQIPQSTLEKIELLEQLRVLEKGYSIIVVETKSPIVAFGGLSVDVPADIGKVEAYLKMVGAD